MKSKKQKKQIPTSQYQQIAYDQTEIGSGARSHIRIRNPGPSDVLCGRGGGINAHVGNVAFRELVQVKKERYNLAANKQEKAEISQDIVDHVKRRGGRFLQKDDSRPYSANFPNSGWWIEIDDTRAIAKTSQALREGAPRIRAKAAKHTPGKSLGKRGRKSFVSSSVSASSASPPAQVNEEPAEKEVIHPIIRGYQDGVHRGKRLIPVYPTSPAEKRQRKVSPTTDRVESRAPTPPTITSYRDQDTIDTPTLLSASHPSNDPEDFVLSSSKCEVPTMSELDADGFPQPMPLYPTASTTMAARQQPRLDTLSIMNPASSSFADIVKPDIRCARMHSLAMSEISAGDDFRGDETFSNPFENEEKLLRPMGASYSTLDSDIDTSGPSVSSINRILKAKSSDSVSMDNKKTNSPKRDYNSNNNDHSRRVQSLRSFMSDLSDIPDTPKEEEQDFHEGLRDIYDAVYPGFTCPSSGESLPTHLIPINLLKGGSAR